MCTARNQIESPDARALNISASKTIANGQSVLGAELIVDSRVDSETALSRPKHISEGIDDRQCLWIERDCVDDRAVVDLIAPHIEKERGAFVNSAAHTAAIFLQKKRRFLKRVRVARVPKLISEVEVDRALELICSGLRENLDSAKTELVVFRSERILVDANFANRFLRRKLAAAKTINENLTSARSRRW